MAKKRRSYTPEFRFQVALESMKGMTSRDFEALLAGEEDWDWEIRGDFGRFCAIV